MCEVPVHLGGWTEGKQATWPTSIPGGKSIRSEKAANAPGEVGQTGLVPAEVGRGARCCALCRSGEAATNREGLRDSKAGQSLALGYERSCKYF